MMYQKTIDSPVESLTIVASEDGLRAIHWRHEDVRKFGVIDAVDGDDPRGVLAETVRQLVQYFVGERTGFDIPLDPVGTDFQRQVWKVLSEIPYGETITYGEQANRLGDPNKARAVGAANGRNPIPIIVPCHRVVGANGSLTGFAGGIEHKAWLLNHERFGPGAATPTAGLELL